MRPCSNLTNRTNGTSRSVTLSATVAFICSQLWGFAVMAQAPSAPSAVAVDSIQDVGVVSKGELIEQRFEIRNEGSSALAIREVEPDCGCTIVEYDETIGVGDSGHVAISLDTKDFRGPIAKSVTVYTNDPKNPSILLVVKADIRPNVEIQPVYARFMTVVGETRSPSEHFLWSEDGPPLEVGNVKSPYPFLEVSVRRATADEQRSEGPEQQWRLEMTLGTEAPVGPLADFVEIETNNSEQKVAKLPVTGFVRPVLAVSPGVADFGEQELDEPYNATLEIKNLGSEAVALTAVTANVNGVETVLEEVEAGRRFLVRLTLDPAMDKGPFRGKIQIRTTSARQPLVEVDLSGTIL